ncbi:MAG: TetR/AcrR family transcriptional regulator [Acidimicrobiaceae bacterium]|nr:TetR/AcrR family transcriptional regulator [Acidimicrobiaceae bacterium]
MTPARARRPYHHGNLRAALLAAAAEEIESVGTAGLSLRGLARRAGVSHAAPAHHFGDKRGLFTALAAEGFQMLHQRTRSTLGRPDALVAAGQRYVAFALEHPAHFEVMFETSLLDPADEELVRERDVAFAVLYQTLQTGTGVTSDEQLIAQATGAWVVVHGVATLWLTGNLPFARNPRLVPRVFRDLAPALLAVVETSLEQLRPAT